MKVGEHTLTTASRRAIASLVAFICIWTAITVGLGWVMIHGQRGMSEMGFPALTLGLALTASLTWWLPGASFAGQPLKISWRRLIPIALAVTVILYGVGMVIENPWQLLTMIIIASAVTAVALRSHLSRREVCYALALALIAGIAGLGAVRNQVYMPAIVWALLQVGLTFFGLLAGWAVQRRLGLFARGMGNILLLQKGPHAAIRGVVEGMLLAIPFTIVFIAAGSTDTEGWVRSWWQPLVALQPGIAEEAWARVFLLSLLMFITAGRVASLRAAWLTSLVIISLLVRQPAQLLSARGGPQRSLQHRCGWQPYDPAPNSVVAPWLRVRYRISFPHGLR